MSEDTDLVVGEADLRIDLKQKLTSPSQTRREANTVPPMPIVIDGEARRQHRTDRRLEMAKYEM